MVSSPAFPATIAEASRRLQDGSLSSLELTEHLLARIEASNAALGAFILPTPELARAQARAADADLRAGRHTGPLQGIPLGIKDIFDTAGVRTTGHSRLLIDRVPDTDAVSVARVLEAGAVMLGKTATHEFAFGGPSFDLPWPPARNPWDLSRFTGGSSSGAAAGVTAGLMLGAFGSDTGGSIRLPASYSGLVGLKPTYGRVSRRGVLPLAQSLDHVGPMAWTAQDCALMLDVMAGHDPLDPASAAEADMPTVPTVTFADDLDRDLGGLRIGVLRHLWEEAEATDETVAALEAALKIFEQRGATLVEVRLPPLRDFNAVYSVLVMSEAAAIHQQALRRSPELFGEIMRMRLYLGSLLSGADYVQASRRRRELCEAHQRLLAGVDVLFTATTPTPAPKIDEVTWDSTITRPSLTSPFNVTGSPVLATRAGFSASGLPLSFQLIGRHFDEATLLALGHQYEQATDWADQRPAAYPLA